MSTDQFVREDDEPPTAWPITDDMRAAGAAAFIAAMFWGVAPHRAAAQVYCSMMDNSPLRWGAWRLLGSVCIGIVGGQIAAYILYTYPRWAIIAVLAVAVVWVARLGLRNLRRAA